MSKKILLIEDHSDARRVLSLVLGYAGHAISEATNASEAIEKSLSESPDLILMDVSLPGVSGFDLARTIKSNPETTKIPIIACSGWTQSAMKTEAQKVGVAEYLTNPSPRRSLSQLSEDTFNVVASGSLVFFDVS